MFPEIHMPNHVPLRVVNRILNCFAGLRINMRVDRVGCRALRARFSCATEVRWCLCGISFFIFLRFTFL